MPTEFTNPATEHTTNQRVIWAEQALAAHRAARRQETPDEADERDLISDLLHVLAARGADIDREIRMALENFREEADEAARVR